MAETAKPDSSRVQLAERHKRLVAMRVADTMTSVGISAETTDPAKFRIKVIDLLTDLMHVHDEARVAIDWQAILEAAKRLHEDERTSWGPVGGVF